jgi:hypothetical protein
MATAGANGTGEKKGKTRPGGLASAAHEMCSTKYALVHHFRLTAGKRVSLSWRELDFDS